MSDVMAEVCRSCVPDLVRQYGQLVVNALMLFFLYEGCEGQVNFRACLTRIAICIRLFLRNQNYC